MFPIPQPQQPLTRKDGTVEAVWYEYLNKINGLVSTGTVTASPGVTTLKVSSATVSATSKVFPVFSSPDATARISSVSVIPGAFSVLMIAPTNTATIDYAVVNAN